MGLHLYFCLDIADTGGSAIVSAIGLNPHLLTFVLVNLHIQFSFPYKVKQNTNKLQVETDILLSIYQDFFRKEK